MGRAHGAERWCFGRGEWGARPEDPSGPDTEGKMTFTEAAAHVLRLVGKPLHYKEITDVAIEKDLLSHVGKSPEVTMGARLAAVVKKDQKDSPLIRVKPGVFALRDWDQAMIDAGLSDRTPALERLANLEAKGEAPRIDEIVEDVGASVVDEDEDEVELEEGEEEEEDIGEDERVRAELAAAATDIFVPEEDDDEPILGAEVETETSERVDGVGKRRRRRRRRGGRVSPVEDEGLPSYTVSDAPLVDSLEEEVEITAPLEVDLGEREVVETRSERSERGERAERHRERHREREREREAERDEEGPVVEAEGRRGSAEDSSPSVLLGLLEQILPSFARQGSAPLKVLAEQAQRRGRLRGDAQALQDALLDVVRSEIVRARYERRRPRFRLSGRSVSLTEWGLEPEVARAERDLFAAAERHTEAFQKAFGRRLQELGPRALTDFFTLLLGQIGFVDVRPVKRAGAHSQEVHLAAIARSPAGDVPTAIIVRRDGRDIGRERIIELRGALHHYGAAHAGLLATTGQVLSGAREEAKAPNAAPVALLDGHSIAKLATQHGLGVNWLELRVPTLDFELFESLKSS